MCECDEWFASGSRKDTPDYFDQIFKDDDPNELPMRVYIEGGYKGRIPSFEVVHTYTCKKCGAAFNFGNRLGWQRQEA
jgi:hypothetical protein